VQSPIDHIQSMFGCKQCANTNNGLLLCRSNTDEFVVKSILIHGDKYDYTEVKYETNTTYVIIKCKTHGTFLQLPEVHLRGNGCPQCGIQKSADCKRYTNEEFIEKAMEVHKGLYNYDNVDYITSHKKVIITCSKHGEFVQTPNAHLSGKGCPICADEHTGDILRKSPEQFIQDAIDTHCDKYDYTKVKYVNSKTPNGHLCGGCKQCANGRISKISQEWLHMIKINCPKLILELHIPTTRFTADGYAPNTNTIYEFHGDYWHGNPNIYNSNIINTSTKCTMEELYKKTQKKKQTCIELGYKYVEMWESQWNRFKRFIRMVQLSFRKRKSNPI
jgi:hypothetical protein